MHTNPRYDAILEHLKRHKRATIQELCRLVYVSEATVRRDLSDMQDLGLLRRIHGGAMYIENTEEVAIAVRRGVNAADKEATAALVLKHLPEFERVFVDNSSTCLALVQRMDLRHKTVFTNSFRVAEALQQMDQVTIIMPGGEIRKNADLVGSMACSALRNFRFDLMLSSCAAIDPSGTFEHSLSVRELKAAAMEQSVRRILLADRTKFHLTSPYRVASLQDYDEIFTNASDDLLAPFRQAGVPIRNQ